MATKLKANFITNHYELELFKMLQNLKQKDMTERIYKGVLQVDYLVWAQRIVKGKGSTVH